MPGVLGGEQGQLLLSCCHVTWPHGGDCTKWYGSCAACRKSILAKHLVRVAQGDLLCHEVSCWLMVVVLS